MMFASCFFQLFTNLSVYFNKVLHISEPVIGVLMALNGVLIVFIEMIIVYKLEGRRSNLTYILIGVSLVAVSFIMLGLPWLGIITAVVMIITATIGEILSMPFMNSFWIGRSNAANRGQYAALYTIAWSGAQSLGPMTAAQIAEKFGFTYLWWGVSGLLLIVLLGFWKLKQHLEGLKNL
jgi:predicted MFS family arabinose efflux permease